MTQSTTRSSYTTLGHVPKRHLILLQGQLLNHVHCNAIHNSQKLETTYMPLDRRMANEIVVHCITEYCSAVYNNDIIGFAGKYMELDKIIMSEVS